MVDPEDSPFSIEAREHLLSQLGVVQRRWFERMLEHASRGEEQPVVVAFAGAGRRLGNGRVDDPAAGWRGWSRAELGRVVLLGAVTHQLESSARLALVEDLFFRGSKEEKRAVLLALPYLPDAAGFTPLAVEACRTNVVDIFEALVATASYPAAYFSDPQFNQMVIKCFFLGVDVRQLSELPRRMNGELLRMLSEYESERKAAGRSVPEGVDWIRSLAAEDLN